MDLIRRVLAFFGHYPQPDLTPGPWFRDYATDWAVAHNIPVEHIDCITSGIVETNKGFAWTTATPEFDQDWFESRGLAFPRLWVTWSSIQDYEGEPGSYIRLQV
jgi:hypothetical protein